jgi:hypothetical protein
MMQCHGESDLEGIKYITKIKNYRALPTGQTEKKRRIELYRNRLKNPLINVGR